MPFRAVAVSALVLSAALVAGCTGLSKSENPLSPTVAGPIPGVNIGQPVPLDPKDGRNIEVANQPITLVLANAGTNGVRPLSYTFEVATDTGFTTKVFIRQGVTPGANGQTSLRLTDALNTGRTYYWRAQALDGANTGPYSGFAHFNIFTPIVIQKPSPDAPINNVMLDSDVPTFLFGNAPRSGPVGPFIYTIEVAENDAFTNRYAIWTVPEQPTVTRLSAPSPLPASKQYFWHVRASDGGNTGPWSDTQLFRTPAPPAPIPNPVGDKPRNSAEFKDWFFKQVEGKPFGQQTLLNLEPALISVGSALTPPNANGDRTKIQDPFTKQWIRVGFGEGHWVWLVQ